MTPNAIERKYNMNCCTCSISDRCSTAKTMSHDAQLNYICDTYTNPEKGRYEDKAKIRKATK